MTELETMLLGAFLKQCDEAMSYMSEYDIPIMLPMTVKQSIAAAEAAQQDEVQRAVEAEPSKLQSLVMDEATLI